jgi:hypothetical protein
MSKNAGKITLVFSVFAVTQCAVLLAMILYAQFEIINPPEFSTVFAVRRMIGALFFGPFVETFIFQFMVIESIIYLCTLSNKITIKASNTLALISSFIAFSAAHYFFNGSYNLIVAGFPGGLALGYIYINFRKYRKSEAFFATWIFHAMTNLYIDGMFYFHYKLLVG